MKLVEITTSPLWNIVSRWRAIGLEVSLSERNGIITLHQIVVPKKDRKTGMGTKFMEELVGYADQTGQIITLSPSTDFGATSVDRLIKFYNRFGFVRNRGKHKDFTISDSMYREPR
jgi:GNAT superfamily N-acetyltransferase